MGRKFSDVLAAIEVEDSTADSGSPGQTTEPLVKRTKVESASPGQTTQSPFKGIEVEADSFGQPIQRNTIFDVNRICDKALKYDLSSITLKCTCCGKLFACSILPVVE